MARRYLFYGPEEWAGLSWAVQQAYLEGFYTEELLERPEPPAPSAGMGVPDDIRSLTAGGSEYRTAAAPVIDLDALIGDLEKRR